MCRHLLLALLGLLAWSPAPSHAIDVDAVLQACMREKPLWSSCPRGAWLEGREARFMSRWIDTAIFMTDELAQHVLQHNYDQTLALSLMEVDAAGELGPYARFMAELETAGRLDLSGVLAHARTPTLTTAPPRLFGSCGGCPTAPQA